MPPVALYRNNTMAVFQNAKYWTKEDQIVLSSLKMMELFGFFLEVEEMNEANLQLL